MAHILASVAVYENEVRSERIRAGQAVARQSGKRWGGSKKGRRIKVNEEQEEAIRRLRAENKSVCSISRTVCLSRPTIYSVFSQMS